MKEETKKTIIPLVIGTSSAILFLVTCAFLGYVINIFASVIFFVIAFFPWMIVTGLTGGYFIERAVK